MEGGYADWYLSSRDELDKLRLNRDAIGGFRVDTGYWSSSEGGASTAWYQYFGSGFADDFSEGSAGLVRAVRSF